MIEFVLNLLWQQTYMADIFYVQRWKDPRLNLPENMTAEYRQVFFFLVWMIHGRVLHRLIQKKSEHNQMVAE